jgi:hypothetical protein
VSAAAITSAFGAFLWSALEALW